MRLVWWGLGIRNTFYLLKLGVMSVRLEVRGSSWCLNSRLLKITELLEVQARSYETLNVALS